MSEKCTLVAAGGTHAPAGNVTTPAAIARGAKCPTCGRKTKPKSTQNMRTPLWLFAQLSDDFGPFTLDAFADETNHLCDAWYDGKERGDGLKSLWHPRTFANPPFRPFGKVIEHAHRQAFTGDCRAVIVGPVGGSQRWRHRYARFWTQLEPDKRISFLEPDGTPTGGADRDTSIYLIGQGWWNPDPSRFLVLPYAVRAP